jgi:hypothetical protein
MRRQLTQMNVSIIFIQTVMDILAFSKMTLRLGITLAINEAVTFFYFGFETLSI